MAKSKSTCLFIYSSPQDVAGLLQLLLLGEVSPDLLLDVEDGSPRLLLLLHRDGVAVRPGKY